jgi:hypothetical protein
MKHPDQNRRPGRPRRGDRAPVPWDEIEKAYVTGEVVRQLPDGSFERRYPSIRDLAARFGVSRSLVGYHSRRHNWPEQRVRFRDRVRTEIQQIAARARAVSTEDAVGILDAYLERFRQAVESGHVRTDAIADFNTAVRLKEFLLGGADSRSELRGAPTLEDLQARHQRLREQLAAMDDTLAGVVPADDPPRGNGASRA